MRTLLLLPLLATLAPAQRDLDPVVIAGSSVPRLLGWQPSRIVGFRWKNGWQQIPVQVDERDVKSFADIRKNNKLQVKALVYVDATTWTGADSDTKFDGDDELAFMYRDAGDPAGFGMPQGVVAGTRVTLAVADPIAGAKRYVYLFASDGSLGQGAGKDYVDYKFVLKSGNYKSTYRLSGLNPRARRERRRATRSGSRTAGSSTSCACAPAARQASTSSTGTSSSSSRATATARPARSVPVAAP